jgi:MFS family permease
VHRTLIRASGSRGGFLRSWLAIAALFCLLGFQYASWASRIPAIKARLGVSDAEIGLLLTVCGVGAAASFPLVAAMMKRLGSPALATLSGLVLAAFPLGLAIAPDYPVALVFACCDGVAVACLDVAMNAQGARLETVYQRTIMSRLHATFSGGILAGALLASAMNALTPTLAVHFAVVAALIVALLVFAWPGLLHEDQPAAAPRPVQADQQADTPAEPRRAWVVLARTALWLGLAMAFGTIVEGAMSDWSALYLKTVAKAPASVTPLGIAVFSAVMVTARLFGDGWRIRWGERRLVGVGAALAGAGLALAVLVGGIGPALLGFACVGLGIAAVTPAVYVAAAGQGTDVLSLVAAMGTVGLLTGPGIIGFIANSASLAWGMGAVAAAAGIVALCALKISWPAASAVANAAGQEAQEVAISAGVDLELG